jgi:hypothetical protein
VYYCPVLSAEVLHQHQLAAGFIDLREKKGLASAVAQQRYVAQTARIMSHARNSIPKFGQPKPARPMFWWLQ